MNEYIVKTKKCCHCSEVKPLYEFNQLRSSPDGINSRCRVCVKETRNLSEVEKLRRTAPKLHSHWKI